MLLNNVYGKNQLLVSADNNKGKTFLLTSQKVKAFRVKNVSSKLMGSKFGGKMIIKEKEVNETSFTSASV